jgi:hypothetical protein
MADKSMLARLLAGIIGPGAQAQPNFAPGPSPFNVPYTGLRNDQNALPNFAPPGSSMPPPSMPSAMVPAGALPGPQTPFTGLTNGPRPTPLPSFEQPGQSASMMPWRNLPPPAAQSAPPQQAAARPTLPPLDGGGQGFGGPEPAPGALPPAYDANLDPRYLPEQWRGRFNGMG